MDRFNVTDGGSAEAGQSALLSGLVNRSLISSPFAAILLGLVILAAITRLVSARRSVPETQHGGKPVPAVPYWIPLLGHLPNMAVDAEGFVKTLRRVYGDGIFALNFGGTTHNVMYTPGLATALLNQKTSNADSEAVSNTLMKTIFGFPAAEQEAYDAALPELMACYKTLLSEPYLGDMVTQTANKLRETSVNLVSFLNSTVDQMPWESNAYARVPGDDGGVMEASLLPLIRDFCAFTANPTLMGSDFLGNFPEMLDDLWILDRGFLYLAAGLPRWIPIPALTSAHIARRKNLQRIVSFHEAMERHYNGEEVEAKWSNLDDVGALVKERMEIYRRYDFSMQARAACEHGLLWAANANSNALVFWMINRIYDDRALLAMLREEIEPYMTVTQPESNGLPISEPARLSHIDIEGLCDRCPLLKSCYIECLRLDAASWSLKVVKQDFLLQSREKDAQAWLLRKGEYAHAAHDLHNTDPNYFENPMVFKPDRHIKYDDKKGGEADMGSIRPYGGGASMCKGRSFAFKECMLFAAAILVMWEIEPARGGQWKLPKHRKATSVYGTDDDTRVLVRRRKLAPR